MRFEVNDYVQITQDAFTRAGEVGKITYIHNESETAIIRFNDGEQLGYELEELEHA